MYLSTYVMQVCIPGILGLSKFAEKEFLSPGRMKLARSF